MKTSGIGVFTAALLVLSTVASAGSEPLLELRINKTAYRGKLLMRTKRYCWLMDRDGRINMVKLKGVSSFRRISSRFSSYSPSDVRSQLLREFGKNYEVVGTRHYLVCATKGQARKYARVFEDLYRTFHIHFAIRGFKISEPEFPLVAVVLPNFQSFARYCKQDGVVPSRGLRGYYMPTTNRVALYDTGNESLTWHDVPANSTAKHWLHGCVCAFGNEHRTSNVERRTRNPFNVRCSMFDVRCSILSRRLLILAAYEAITCLRPIGSHCTTPATSR